MRCASARSSSAGRRESVVVVDEDLGPLGRLDATGGSGFKELVAEVGLGQVGLVLALEVVAAGALVGGLASAAGSVRADRRR